MFWNSLNAVLFITPCSVINDRYPSLKLFTDVIAVSVSPSGRANKFTIGVPLEILDPSGTRYVLILKLIFYSLKAYFQAPKAFLVGTLRLSGIIMLSAKNSQP